jgi:hypothetical protein
VKIMLLKENQTKIYNFLTKTNPQNNTHIWIIFKQ